jgi:hypothetical protein
MTKYILHGGATSNKTIDNKKFFFEITNGLPDKVNVLCAYFSRPRKEWPKLFKQDKLNFSSASPQKAFNFMLADDKIYALIEQIKKADAIYFRGGNTELLKETLGKIKNLKELWNGKVIAGSSAGAYVLSKYYYSESKDIYGKGLGILPIKAFCHYTEEKSDKLKTFRERGENLQVYTIPEEKFYIIEQ